MPDRDRTRSRGAHLPVAPALPGPRAIRLAPIADQRWRAASRASVVTLCLYVESGCRSCANALELARRVRAEYPSVEVRVIDIGVSSEQLADGVFAVPTMVLDGEMISLGTPSWERIARVLDTKLAAE